MKFKFRQSKHTNESLCIEAENIYETNFIRKIGYCEEVDSYADVHIEGMGIKGDSGLESLTIRFKHKEAKPEEKRESIVKMQMPYTTAYIAKRISRATKELRTENEELRATIKSFGMEK